MESKIIKVTPVDNYLSIGWMITNKCNYDCMYCPDKWHNGNNQYTLVQLQKYWIDIFDKTKDKNLKYKIGFTGGEATINKDFITFLEWLQQNYNNYIHMILLTTNGSASVNYYKKLFKIVNNITFSFHSEHADEIEFYKKIIKLKDVIGVHNFIHVNIMNEVWNQKRIVLYTDILNKHSISYSINEIDYELKTRSFPIMKGKQNLEI